MSDHQDILIYGVTDVGCSRSGNEDCFLIQTPQGEKPELNNAGPFGLSADSEFLIAVSDGMGGAAAGDIASQTALSALRDYVAEHASELLASEPEPLVDLMEKGIIAANEAVMAKAREMNIRKSMGATITAGYLKGDVLYLFQVGDSRAYVGRGGVFKRVTRDQSFVGHLVEMGTITEAQARRHPQRNVILQALGTQKELKVDISYVPLCKNDLVLLCSDGLYGELEPDDLTRRISGAEEGAIEKLLNVLVEDAKEAGGSDNITIVGFEIADHFPKRGAGEDPRYMAVPFLDRDNPFSRSKSIFR